MNKALLSLLVIMFSMHPFLSSFAANSSSDQVALLQLHRFNQLQMQMAKMATARTKDTKVRERARQVYEVHRTINDKVSNVAEEAGLNLLNVPKEVEQRAKSEYRDDFVEIAQEIQSSAPSKINKLYPKWAKESNKAMLEKLKQNMKEINSPKVKALMEENIKKIKASIL